MLCQNCGKNEVNFKYTQIINGVKKEMALCHECARKLGVESVDFSMPINFSSFFSDFFHETENFLPSFAKTNLLDCHDCGTTFDDFADTGEFGCGNCYITFADRILPVLKNLHGSSQYIGRDYREAIDELVDNKSRFEASQKQRKTETVKQRNEKTEKQEDVKDEKKLAKEKQLESLKKDLQKAIQEERYEDAAKIRDYIKEIQEN